MTRVVQALVSIVVAIVSLTGCRAFFSQSPPSPSTTITTTPLQSPSKLPPGEYNMDYCGVSKDQQGKPSKVLLTIDDFPSDHDPGKKMIRIAEWAKQHDVMMEAFPIKQKVDAYDKKMKTNVIEELRSRGTYVSNHTFTHPVLSRLPLSQALKEIRSGVESTYLRPPYGEFTPAIKQAVEAEGHRLCLWTLDTKDWQQENDLYPPASELVRRVETKLKALPHDVPIVILGHYHTHYPEALQGILDTVLHAGYQVCTNPGPVSKDVPFPIC